MVEAVTTTTLGQETPTKSRPGPAVPPRQLLRVIEDAARDINDVFLSLHSSPVGLNRIQALLARDKYGPNEIAHQKAQPWWMQLLLAFHNPFNWLLLILAAVSLFTEDVKAAVVISVMVLISGFLRFVQEFRSNRAAEKLRAMVDTKATVSRPHPRIGVPADAPAAFGLSAPPEEPKLEEIPISQLVPGDVIHLSAGDLVPADVRLITTKDLFVSQATLTGESLPVEKTTALSEFVGRQHGESATPLDLPNICFMGTTVVSLNSSGQIQGTTTADFFFGVPLWQGGTSFTPIC